MNTAWLVRHALEAAEAFGRRVSEVAIVECDFEDLADKHIEPCRNCIHRHMPNRGQPYRGDRPPPEGCPIRDDYMARVVMPKMREADGFIFGSPVYTLSFTSKFRLFAERLSPLVWSGALTNKPAAAVAVGELPVAGQETCLEDINRIIRGGEMICVSWLMGAPGCSGPPHGPAPWEEDYGRRVGVERDRYARWLAVVNGRRVAEFAIMLKLARRELGDLYRREFIQVYHPPHGQEPWAWRSLP